MHIVGLLINDTCITLSIVTENSYGLTLQAYQEHILEHHAIYQLYIYNPTVVRALIKNFICSNKLTDPYVIIALDSPVLNEYWDNQDAPTQPGYRIGQQPLFGKTYGAYLRHEQVISYKLLALHCFNLLGITTLTTALYYAHRVQKPSIDYKPNTICLDDIKEYLTCGSSQLTQTSEGLYTIGKLLYETA